jgi:hypothetical protein
MVLSRRKPRVYQSHVQKKKPNRQGLTVEECAFCCSVVIGGGASFSEVVQLFPNSLTVSGLSRLVKRVRD